MSIPSESVFAISLGGFNGFSMTLLLSFQTSDFQTFHLLLNKTNFLIKIAFERNLPLVKGKIMNRKERRGGGNHINHNWSGAERYICETVIAIGIGAGRGEYKIKLAMRLGRKAFIKMKRMKFKPSLRKRGFCYEWWRNCMVGSGVTITIENQSQE